MPGFRTKLLTVEPLNISISDFRVHYQNLELSVFVFSPVEGSLKKVCVTLNFQQQKTSVFYALWS